MAEGILSKIQELSEEREKILAREGSHHAESGDGTGIQTLWDLRRRELAGDRASDFYDRYDG